MVIDKFDDLIDFGKRYIADNREDNILAKFVGKNSVIRYKGSDYRIIKRN